MGDGAARYCRVHPRFTLTATPHVRQGHILASSAIGDCYNWGKGVAIDYPRAMAAYKVGAEAGDALSQHQLGYMYYTGRGVASSWRRARELYQRAIELGGSSQVVQNMQTLNQDIQQVRTTNMYT